MLKRAAILATAFVIVAAAVTARADSFRSRLEKGNAYLRTGDAPSALREYDDLKTDDPENPYIYYNTGRAHYKSGVSEIELNAAEDAITSFNSAKEDFAKAAGAPEPDLRRLARFNSANCTTQVAKLQMQGQKYEQAVESFKSAVKEYEDYLKSYPDDQNAKKNLDHVRYLLKQALQNPPPPQEQQQQQNQQQKQDEGDQQKQDQQQQGDQQQQQDQQPQDQQEQQQQEQQKQQEQQQQQAQEKEAQEMQQQANEQQQQDNQDQAQADQKQERQNVDAILQSLEDVDKREQKDVRNQRKDIKINTNWW